jgi:hypothetical protein
MSLFKKGFSMSSATFQPQHFGGAWLGAVMARPAKCNQVFNRIGLGNRPRNDVVNIKPLALSVKRALSSPALATGMTVTTSDGFSHILPVCAAPVMLEQEGLT